MIEEPQTDQLRQLLSRDQLKRQLRKLLFPKEQQTIAEFRKNVHTKFAEIATTEILDQLDPPAITTLQDLRERLDSSFHRFLSPRGGWSSEDELPALAEDEFETGIEEWRKGTVWLTAGFRFGPMPIAEFCSPVPDVRGVPIWSNDRFSVSLWGTGPVGRKNLTKEEIDDGGTGGEIILYADGHGYFTEPAMERSRYEVARLLPSLIYSSTFLADLSGAYTPRSIPACVWAKSVEAAWDIHRLPTIDDFQANLEFVRDCLGVYYAGPNATDLGNRLRTAIQFLVEADQQTHPSVALSLCFCAIEGMLDKGEYKYITEALSNYLAGLFEPDVRQRARAMDFVRNLYERRCAALHGEDLDANVREYHDCRLLAAMTLRTLLNFYEEMGSAATTERLIAELRKVVIGRGASLLRNHGLDGLRPWKGKS